MSDSRNAPDSLKVSFRKWILVGLGIVLLWGGVVWWLTPTNEIVISYDTTRILEPLHPAGGVDYEQAINDWKKSKLKGKENGFVSLLPFASKLDDSSFRNSDSARRLCVYLGVDALPQYRSDLEWIDLNEFHLRFRPSTDREKLFEERRALVENALPWNRESSPDVALWIEQNKTGLDAVCEMKPGCDIYEPTVGRFADAEPRLLFAHEVLDFPRWQLANALFLRGCNEIERGETSLAIFNLDGLLFYSGFSTKSNELGYQGSLAVVYSSKLLERLLDSGRLLRPQLVKLYDSFQAMPATIDVAEYLDKPIRWSTLDSVQSVFLLEQERSDELFGREHVFQQFLYHSSLVDSADFNLMAESLNLRIDHLVAELKRNSIAVQKQSIGEFLNRLADEYVINSELEKWSSRFSYTTYERSLDQADMALDTWVFELEVYLDEQVSYETNKRLCLLACALELFRSERGHFPSKLKELVPGFLDELPRDELNQTDFRYIRVGSGYKLYGVGMDGIDNGGTALPFPREVGPGEDIVFERTVK